MNTTVVIAGAGPAGLMLACELGLAGVPATVVERSPQPRVDVPGVALNVGSAELLDQRGLLERLRQEAPTAPLPRAHFALMPLDTERTGVRHQGSVIVAQHDVERVLAARAVELGAAILRGREVVGVDQDARGVTVTVRTADGTDRIGCRYLVGCDGVDSDVRRLAGIAFPGTDEPFTGIVGDIEVPLKNLAPVHLGSYHSPSGGVYMCGPMGEDVVRVATAEFGALPADPGHAVSAQGAREIITRLTGADPGPLRPRWLRLYRNLNALAETYRAGSVFLAGDAAHAMFPLNGQAITTGLDDAVNLGWKLAAAVRGDAPDGLLDTFHRERHPVGRAACDNIAAQVAMCGQPDAVGPLRRLVARLAEFDEAAAYLTDLIMGLGFRYDLAPDGESAHPLLGVPQAPTAVKSPAGATDTAALLRTGRGVLLDLSDTGEAARTATAWSDRVDIVSGAGAPCLPARALLLRPDGHVAWATDDDGSAGLEAALARWFGAAAGSRA